MKLRKLTLVSMMNKYSKARKPQQRQILKAKRLPLDQMSHKQTQRNRGPVYSIQRRKMSSRPCICRQNLWKDRRRLGDSSSMSDRSPQPSGPQQSRTTRCRGHQYQRSSRQTAMGSLCCTHTTFRRKDKTGQRFDVVLVDPWCIGEHNGS